MSRINLKYLNSLCGGDTNFLTSMLVTYVDETRQDISQMEEAFENRNIERIGFYSHKIKTSFQMLGLKKLAEYAEILERKSKSGKYGLTDLNKEYNFIIRKSVISFDEAKSIIKSF